MATKKITVKAPGKKVTHKAAQELRNGSPVGARVEAERRIAKKAASKKGAPKKKK